MIVDCALYEDGRRRGGELALADAYEAGRDAGNFVWIGLYEPSSKEFDSVAREFTLHELAVEDAIKAHQRPKLERYGDSLFIVLKTVRYDEEHEELDTGEILLFIGEGFVVSVRHGEGSALVRVRERMAERPDLMRCGTGAVLHAIVDRVVDDYLPVLQSLEDDIREVEAEVFSSGRHSPAERIYKLSREVNEFQRAAAPLVEPLRRLAAGELDVVHDDMRSYFRDVYDHLVREVDTIQGEREQLASVLHANLTQVSVRQNDDMRRISAWVAIIAVPTMIAGIYGMNFDHMPELRWTYGYPLVLAVILTICVSLYAYFRRSGWL